MKLDLRVFPAVDLSPHVAGVDTAGSITESVAE